MNPSKSKMHEPRWVMCSTCERETSHDVLYLVADPRWDVPLFRNHMLTQCGGCRSFAYLIEDGTYEDRDPTGELNIDFTAYPAAADFKPIPDAGDLPTKVRKVYVEVLSALNAGLAVLAGIGLRTLIEAICRERKITGKNLEQLIDGLANKGLLAPSQARILHALRFLGNVAAHETVSAKPGELRAALDIAEMLMRTIYVVPKLAKEVKTGRRRLGRRTPKPKAPVHPSSP